MSWFSCVGRVWCVSAVWVQAKTNTSRCTHELLKSRFESTQTQTYVLRGDDICNLQQKRAQNSRDERIGMCGMCGMCEYEQKHTFRGWNNSAKTNALFYSEQKLRSEGQRNLAIKTNPRAIFACWAYVSVEGLEHLPRQLHVRPPAFMDGHKYK